MWLLNEEQQFGIPKCRWLLNMLPGVMQTYSASCSGEKSLEYSFGHHKILLHLDTGVQIEKEALCMGAPHFLAVVIPAQFS